MRNETTQKFLVALGTYVACLGFMMSVACTHQSGRLIEDGEISSNEEGSVDVASEGSEEATEEQAAPAADLASTGEEKKDEENLVAEMSTDGSASDATPSTEVASNEAALPGDPLMPSNESGSPADAAATAPAMDSGPNWVGDEASASNPDNLTSEPKATGTAGKSGKSTLPKVPTSAIKKGSQALNRYYFFRNGDTADTLSQLFYGNTEHANEIVKWNGQASSWKAGKVIFYISADQPDDTEMVSFYKEQGIVTEPYVVKKGDQLSSIAGERYGNPMSWKEIASYNGVGNPDQINPGDQLLLLPKAMTSIHAKPAAVTAQLPSAEAPKTDAMPKTDGAVALAPMKPTNALSEEDGDKMAFGNNPDQPKLADSQVIPPPTQMDKARDASLAALEMKPETDFTPFAIGGGLLMLAVFLFFIRRSRNRAHAEFLE